jgi:hypothetical protein
VPGQNSHTEVLEIIKEIAAANFSNGQDICFNIQKYMYFFVIFLLIYEQEKQ